MTAFRTLKNKIDELTNMIDFGDFPHCLLLLHEENKSGSSVTELRYRMFTKKNLSRDRSPSTLDPLVLHLHKKLIFFMNYFTSFIKNKIYNIDKKIICIKQFRPFLQ